MSGVPTTIYVLPSEEGKPPAAVIGQALVPGVLAGTLVSWDGEAGVWVHTGTDDALPDDVCEAITDHARSLGVVIVTASGE